MVEPLIEFNTEVTVDNCIMAILVCFMERLYRCIFHTNLTYIYFMAYLVHLLNFIMYTSTTQNMCIGENMSEIQTLAWNSLKTNREGENWLSSVRY